MKDLKRKCQVASMYSKNGNKDLHFYCEFCGKEMEYSEDRICEVEDEKDLKEKIIEKLGELEDWIVSLKARYRNYLNTPDEDKTRMFDTVKVAEEQLKSVVNELLSLQKQEMIKEIEKLLINEETWIETKDGSRINTAEFNNAPLNHLKQTLTNK